MLPPFSRLGGPQSRTGRHGEEINHDSNSSPSAVQPAANRFTESAVPKIIRSVWCCEESDVHLRCGHAMSRFFSGSILTLQIAKGITWRVFGSQNSPAFSSWNVTKDTSGSMHWNQEVSQYTTLGVGFSSLGVRSNRGQLHESCLFSGERSKATVFNLFCSCTSRCNFSSILYPPPPGCLCIIQVIYNL
jgi:hypothetical protein